GRLARHGRGSRAVLDHGAAAVTTTVTTALVAAVSTVVAARATVVAAVLTVIVAILTTGGAVAGRPLERRVRHLAAEELDGADGGVVTGDDEVDAVGIAVGVDHADHRDAQAHRLVDGDVLLLGVDHEQRAGEAGEVLHATEVALQLLALTLEHGDLLLGEALEGPVLGHLLDALEAIDALLDGLGVGQGPAQPAAGHEELAGAEGLLTVDVLRLLLGTDEEDRLAARGHVGHESERRPRHVHRLLQVDDVDAVAGTEDVRLH